MSDLSALQPREGHATAAVPELPTC